MDSNELKAVVEAMIFVAEEPLTEGAIAAALAADGVERAAVRACLEAMEAEWGGDDSRGIALVQVAGGYQFRTKAHLAQWLARLNLPRPVRLSGPALETLAIVAYRQPIVRSEIERIRGVDSGGVLKTLLERRLLRIVGRQDEPGQPLLYGTTREFLEIFNLNALAELPSLKDIEDIMRERRMVTEAASAAAAEGGAGAHPSVARQDDDDEEPTEVIRDEGDEGDDEAARVGGLDGDARLEEKDMESLANLESSLKDVRRLERAIFPKLPAEAADVSEGGKEDAGPQSQGEGEVPVPGFVAGDEASEGPRPGPDAPGTDDRAGE